MHPSTSSSHPPGPGHIAHNGQPPFIVPSAIDRLDLTPNEFRVLSHIVSRGNCTASAKTMAECCKIKRDTVFTAIARLEQMGIIERKKCPGHPSAIQCIHPLATRPPKRDTTRPPKGDNPQGGTASEKGYHPSPQRGHHPSPQRGHKRDNLKESHKEEKAAAAEKLIAAHPRPSLNRDALEAARQALCIDDFETILAGTTAYAGAVLEWPPDERAVYTMTAAKFFQGHHWRDDPQDWTSRRAAKTRLNGHHPTIDIGGRKPAGVWDCNNLPPIDEADLEPEPDFDAPRPKPKTIA